LAVVPRASGAHGHATIPARAGGITHRLAETPLRDASIPARLASISHPDQPFELPLAAPQRRLGTPQPRRSSLAYRAAAFGRLRGLAKVTTPAVEDYGESAGVGA
jgi:hypothetical protein